jgi:hypothetical protein
MKTLSDLYDEDQSDRSDPILLRDFDLIVKRDAKRRKIAREIISKRKQLSGKEYYFLATLYQHGPALSHSRLAIRYARHGIALCNEDAKWLYAAAVDRFNAKQGKPQKYGTQFIKKNARSKWKLHPVDPSIADEERAKWNVPPLAVAKAKVKHMNER